MARQSWTDERLDDRFDHLEATMDERFKRVESEMKTTLREEIEDSNAELRSEIGSLGAQLATLNQTLTRVGFGFAAALLAGVLFHLL